MSKFQVGDVVTWAFYAAPAAWVVVEVVGDEWRGLRIDCGYTSTALSDHEGATYLRPATMAERARAGLGKPEWVKVTRETAIVPYTVGQVVRVTDGFEWHSIQVAGGWILAPGSWEPARAPEAEAPVVPAPGQVWRAGRCAEIDAVLIEKRPGETQWDAYILSEQRIRLAHVQPFMRTFLRMATPAEMQAAGLGKPDAHASLVAEARDSWLATPGAGSQAVAKWAATWAQRKIDAAVAVKDAVIRAHEAEVHALTRDHQLRVKERDEARRYAYNSAKRASRMEAQCDSALKRAEAAEAEVARLRVAVYDAHRPQPTLRELRATTEAPWQSRLRLESEIRKFRAGNGESGALMTALDTYLAAKESARA